MLMRWRLTGNEPTCQERQCQSYETYCAVDQCVLNPRATFRFRVRDAGEGDHGVERQIKPGKNRFEEVIEFLLRAKCFRRGLVAHLNKISEREIGQRVG